MDRLWFLWLRSRQAYDSEFEGVWVSLSDFVSLWWFSCFSLSHHQVLLIHYVFCLFQHASEVFASFKGFTALGPIEFMDRSRPVLKKWLTSFFVGPDVRVWRWDSRITWLTFFQRFCHKKIAFYKIKLSCFWRRTNTQEDCCDSYA